MVFIETLRSRASVCGHITDAVTGRGIPLATVQVKPAGPVTRTRADGFFFFADLAPGKYTLEASAPQLAGRYVAVSATDIEVVADSAGRPVFDPDASIALPPTRVGGTVAESGTANPVAGATVRIRSSESSTVSGKNGQYILSPLQPGSATVEVSARGYQNAVTAVSLNAGQQATANFTLTKA